ncbi:histone-lysine N-methyltransferase SETDB2 [Emydura macquarii macquarii]|uniref:histone-lysine N-methyltransferase SETDB2 n=1 Tax=Emydura macquarii macquarii TaxID=1129001 RepID=UPI00352ABAF3
MQLLQRMEGKKIASERLDVETHSTVCGGRDEGDAEMFWRQMEDERVDFIFEQVQNVLLSLKQKIKDRTATNEEYFQALMLVNSADVNNLLALTNVNDVTTEDNMQRSKPRLQPSVSNENTTVSPLRMEVKEKSCSENEEVSSETRELPLKLCYQNHDCSTVCLASRPLNSYKGENPLKIPILCHFQRRHAKADSLSKSLDVNYKAPCGRSLRNFQDVQSYLFETQCNFLFVDHFSFNTYVQLGRNTLNREALVFDFDISNGAESVPISFCNEVDCARLPYFKYRKASWPRGYYLNNFSSMFLDSCNCTDGCTDRSKCACLQLTAKGCSENSASPSNRSSSGYRYKRLEGPLPTGIYECNLSCKCDRMSCQNRVVQHGIQVRLQVFNTERKGWGVRCLDDIDKGTFVCTYSGRLMSRAGPQEAGDVDREDEKKDAVNDKSPSSLSIKRKLDTACSDSEIELVQTGKDSINRRCEPLPQPVEDKYKPVVVQNYGYNPRNLRSPNIRRSKTRTAILQARRLKLGVTALMHDASSDEDGSSQPQQSTKTKLTTGTKKGKEKSNLQQKLGDLEDTMQTEPIITDSAECKEKRPSPQDATCGKSAWLDDAYVMKQSRGLLQRDDFEEEKNRKSKQDPLCNEEAEGDETSLKNSNKENIYLLDATKEGNVGRFLNHSCCPNLFVQSVFVETHNRNFPWVAFFTNRHVKAGTELTWDYDYEAGSMPEIEIPCQCGVQKCRKKVPLLPWRTASQGALQNMQSLQAPDTKRARCPLEGYANGVSASPRLRALQVAGGTECLVGAEIQEVPQPRATDISALASPRREPPLTPGGGVVPLQGPSTPEAFAASRALMGMPTPPSSPRPRVPGIASRGKPTLGYSGGWQRRDERSPPRRSRRDSDSSPPSSDQGSLSPSAPRRLGRSRGSGQRHYSPASEGSRSLESRRRSPAHASAPAATAPRGHSPGRSPVRSPITSARHRSPSQQRSRSSRRSTPRDTRHRSRHRSISPRHSRHRSRSSASRHRSSSPRHSRHRSPSQLPVRPPSAQGRDRYSRSPARSPVRVPVAKRKSRHRSRSPVDSPHTTQRGREMRRDTPSPVRIVAPHSSAPARAPETRSSRDRRGSRSPTPSPVRASAPEHTAPTAPAPHPKERTPRHRSRSPVYKCQSKSKAHRRQSSSSSSHSPPRRRRQHRQDRSWSSRSSSRERGDRDRGARRHRSSNIVTQGVSSYVGPGPVPQEPYPAPGAVPSWPQGPWQWPYWQWAPQTTQGTGSAPSMGPHPPQSQLERGNSSEEESDPMEGPSTGPIPQSSSSSPADTTARDWGNPLPDFKTHQELLKRLAENLKLDIKELIEEEDPLFGIVGPAGPSRIALPVHDRVLKLVKPLWETPASVAPTSKTAERKYYVPLQGFEYLFNHPAPGTLVVDAVNQRDRQGAHANTPKNKESKKLDLFGRKVYSTAVLQLHMANYQALLGHYNLNLWSSLQRFLQGLPQDMLADFNTLVQEGSLVANAALQSASDATDAAGRAMASGIVMHRAAWLQSSGLSPEVQQAIQNLPFTGTGLFSERTDEKLHALKDSRATLKSLGLYVPQAARRQGRSRPPRQQQQPPPRPPPRPPQLRRDDTKLGGVTRTLEDRIRIQKDSDQLENCLSPGDFQIMEKMVKIKCAFCPADEECAIMYIAEKQNLAVHQDCLLYSSGFVESEEHNPENQDTRFDVASVQSEIRRGKRLMCNFCRKKGATVGCEIKTCRRSYHYFCALCDDAALETDGGQGIYRVFCPKHDPDKRTNHYDADNKRNRHGMKTSTFTEKMSTEETAAENSLRLLRKKHNKHKVRIEILRKCKQAGLLDGIFKEMLDTLHLAKEKLMDDNTSETEYEETVIPLFDCSLFENILTNVHSGTEKKIQELLETRKRLDTQIELLQDLKEVLPLQENIASASSSVSE